MKLKKAETLLEVLGGVMIVLFLLCSCTGKGLYGYLGIIAAFAALIEWVLFGRCPHCGKYLGRSMGKYCPHCGGDLEEE